MVILKEDNLPVCNWPLGRILEVYHGKDNKIRVVIAEKRLKEKPISEITPSRGRLEEENGRTRTKLEYVTRARMEERREGGLTAPKRVFEEHQKRSGKENAAFFLQLNEKKGVCKGNLQTTQQV
ncbi:hypothetical protein TNCV_2653111 [Trichonephila clavipes]|nr:hypothetical protein TNCV_2653111 [Trichonephila clavipes]